MAPKTIAIVAGVGPGTGAAVARRFAKSYPVVLLARKSESYSTLAEEIKQAGGEAVGISADTSDSASVKSAFEQIRKAYGEDVIVAAAIYNVGGRFTRAPFLEIAEDDFISSVSGSVGGAFRFAQATLPLLVKATETSAQHPPTLIFTGATASVRGGANFSSFAAGKFATRALAQSLAREYGPKGVHVAHTVIDGLIDTPATAKCAKDAGPDAKINPAGIAESYWGLHAQDRSAWTFELDIRPFGEKW